MEQPRVNLINFLVAAAILVVAYLLYVAATPRWIAIESQIPNPQSMKEWLQQMPAVANGDLAADKLQEHCNSDAAALDGFCTGYLLGFIEGYELSSSFKICTGESLQSATQIEQAFQNYMDDHPEHWKKPRAPILGAALQQTFPCPSYY